MDNFYMSEGVYSALQEVNPNVINAIRALWHSDSNPEGVNTILLTFNKNFL